MTDNCQKIKLLKLVEMLRQETDEQNPLRTCQICSRLNAMGITCDRRTLSKDIALLNEENYEIMSTMVGHEKGYYIADRTFSVPELKILLDAVQASSFITRNKTEQLIEKIAALAGSHRAEILKNDHICFNTRKHSNESIFYSVGFLEEALRTKRRVSFLYFDLNEQHERVYRKAKQRYTTEPIALVYSEDNYYLMCYSSKYGSIINYRVDRMEQVTVEEEPISAAARKRQSDTDTAKYTEQVFKMFNGSEEVVTLVFDDKLIGPVYDKFGENIRITRVDANTCRARVRIRVSPIFYGWLFQMGTGMRIIAPENLKQEYREMCMKMLDVE